MSRRMTGKRGLGATKAASLGQRPLTDEWLASFFPHEDIDGAFYCTATDLGALPPDVVREVNTAAVN